MAKARLILTNGTKVLIEGNSAEVATLLDKFSQPVQSQNQRTHLKGQKQSNRGLPKGTRKARKGPVGYIMELSEEGFFKTKRTLPDIQKKLEEIGHIYAQTSLSPAMLNLTKKRILRRLSEKNGWVYVKA